MAVILLEIVFAPVLVFFAILLGKRYRAEQKRRIALYRDSPESHLLHLND